ncbi:hypothetical protein [Paraburkholderia sp. MM6662-R1]|uniref:hypothetical protein n=1 Tax=Paraburkholderia sp. MM6662-R1 TaxID=2991066 RepID=UPI003D243BD2
MVTGQRLDHGRDDRAVEFDERVGLLKRAPEFCLRKPDGVGMVLQGVTYEPVDTDVRRRAITLVRAEDDARPIVVEQRSEAVDVTGPACRVGAATRWRDRLATVDGWIEQRKIKPGTGMAQLVPSFTAAAWRYTRRIPWRS